MLHNLICSTTILNTFSTLSSFSLAKSIWDRYKKYAIPKIEDTTSKLKDSLFYIKGLAQKQAEKELKTLNQIIPILFASKEILSFIGDKVFHKFKNIAIEFLKTADLLQNNSQDIAKIHGFYKMSILPQNWDSKEGQQLE